MNTAEIETTLRNLERTTLTRYVRAALNSESAEVRVWGYQAIGIGRGSATGGVYRVTGTADDHGVARSWALVVKVLSPLAAGNVPAVTEDIAHPLYWKREALAYQSGLLDDLPTGMRAPRCFAVEERDGTIWLWLEAVEDTGGQRWSLAQYAQAARLIGNFNGAYVAGRAMPPHAWLSRDGSPRGVLDHFAWMQDVVRDPATWAQPMVRAAYSIPVADRLLRLWADRGALLDRFEQLPTTLCHLDAWRKNMFAPSGVDGSLVVIDWAYVGRGVVGTDAGDLMGASYGLFGAEPCTPAALDAVIFDHYIKGLEEVGWHGDRQLVRLAYATFTALKYAGLLLELYDVRDQDKHARWEAVAGQPMDALMRHKAALTYFLLDLADEARQLR